MRPDKRFILALNRPLGIIKRPFAPPAKKLGWSERKLLERIEAHKRRGFIRRLGLVLAHRNIGLKSNVLVAWNVPVKKLKAAVVIFTKASEVSHCYQRKTCPDWPYNIYTMVHGKNRRACLRSLKELSEKSGVIDCRALFTLKEFKKTKADIWRTIKLAKKGSSPG